ncbi:hypothetical protein [Desulfosporosinus metallidurans]|nr:hypothetical protein [Desulfosporosinus metallidurans]
MMFKTTPKSKNQQSRCRCRCPLRCGLEEIMERLGHADDEITRRVYLHVTKTMKKEASQKFSELMKSL